MEQKPASAKTNSQFLDKPLDQTVDVTDIKYIGKIRTGRFRFPDGSSYEGEYLTVPIPTFIKVDNPALQSPSPSKKAPSKGKASPADEETAIPPLPPTAIMRQGQGKYTCNVSKAVYTGEWLMDQPQGQGKLVYADGTTYEGAFSEGKINGTGVYRWPDSSRCSGTFTNGIPNGVITYIDDPDDIVEWSGKVSYGSSVLKYTLKAV